MNGAFQWRVFPSIPTSLRLEWSKLLASLFRAIIADQSDICTWKRLLMVKAVIYKPNRALRTSKSAKNKQQTIVPPHILHNQAKADVKQRVKAPWCCLHPPERTNSESWLCGVSCSRTFQGEKSAFWKKPCASTIVTTALQYKAFTRRSPHARIHCDLTSKHTERTNMLPIIYAWLQRSCEKSINTKFTPLTLSFGTDNVSLSCINNEASKTSAVSSLLHSSDTVQRLLASKWRFVKWSVDTVILHFAEFLHLREHVRGSVQFEKCVFSGFFRLTMRLAFHVNKTCTSCGWSKMAVANTPVGFNSNFLKLFLGWSLNRPRI